MIGLKPHLKRVGRESLLPCLFTSLSFFLIGPITLYVGNASEFSFYLSDILPLLLLSWAVCFAVLMGICLLIRKDTARAVVSAVILGIGIGFYVQSNFMSGGYGQLTGYEIDWASMIGRGIVNTIVWLVCIGAPVAATIIWKKQRMTIQKMASGILMAIQVLACVILIFSSGVLGSKAEKEFAISTDGALTLSDKKNVVVFLLDDFSAPLCESIVADDPAYNEMFDGFTFFPDTTGSGCTTKAGLPFVLTGMWNENQYPYAEYLNRGYDNDLYALLDELDYDTRLFVGSRYVGSEAVHWFDNMTETKNTVSASAVTPLMYKFTAFNYMPHFLKPFFWFYSGEFSQAASAGSDDALKLSPDYTFYKTIDSNGLTVDESLNGAYRFYYMNGAHQPYTMNEEAAEVESGSVDKKTQATGALKVVASYLAQLKDAGIYDNTMVVVLADHGNWTSPEVMAPMLMVKPFASETAGLEISSAQITYEDLMPTLVKALGGETDGRSVFEIGEEEQRERRFLFYSWDGDWDSDYLPEEYEYLVYGNVMDETARRQSGRIYTKDGIIENDTSYTLGTEVYYTTETANDMNYMYYGMSYAEENFRWTVGTETSWIFPLADYDGRDLVFELWISAIRGERQRVSLIVNGMELEEVEVTEPGVLRFLIPSELIDTDEVSILLECPDASGTESDKRVRGLAVKYVKLDYAEELYELGTEINYTEAFASEQNYVVSGLSQTERDFTWTSGNTTEWAFYVQDYKGGDLRFDLDLALVKNGKQHVKAYVNGEFLEEATVTNGKDLHLTIPEALLEDGSLTIRLEYPDAASSKSDARVLALAIVSAVLEKAR